ncbi:hypothetical protein HC928_10615 [bacterium]|nr:hypothetical protein [bacterium]
MAELLIQNYQDIFNTVILRCFFVYGPRQRNMLIPGLLKRSVMVKRLLLRVILESPLILSTSQML